MRGAALRDRIATWAVPFIMVVVAVTQVVVASTGPLSPWKGGGFGMFSTVDSPPVRAVRASLHTDDGLVHLDVRAFVSQATTAERRAYLDARAYPTSGRLGRLADALCGLSWEIDEGIARPVAASKGDAHGGCTEASGLVAEAPDEAGISGIEITVVRPHYDRASSVIAPGVVATHHEPVAVAP